MRLARCLLLSLLMMIGVHQRLAQIIGAIWLNCKWTAHINYSHGRLRRRRGRIGILWIVILLLLLLWLLRILIHRRLRLVLLTLLRLLLARIIVRHLNLVIHRCSNDHVVGILEGVWLSWIYNSDIIFLYLVLFLFFCLTVAVVLLQVFQVSHHIDIGEGCIEVFSQYFLCLLASFEQLIFCLYDLWWDIV